MRGALIKTCAVGVVGALLMASATLGTPAGAAPPATGLAPGSEYVALGDSYSAGYGIPPTTNKPVPGCAQSARDYPHQVAAALRLKLTDVACSGAVTANIDQTPQVTNLAPGGGTAPLQDKALSKSTKVVTLTIGGNDLGFSTIAASCFALSATGPVLLGLPNNANCKTPYTAGTTAATNPQIRLEQVVAPALTRVLGDITNKAPNAKVFVLQYPAVAPDGANTPKAGCFRAALGPTGLQPPFPTDTYPFTTIDVPYLQQLQSALNAAVVKAATAAGDTPVSTYAATLGHSPCAGAKTQWVNGITITSISLGSQPPATLAAGATYLAGQAIAAITAAFPPPKPTPTSTTPTPTSSTPAPTTSHRTRAAAASGTQLAATGTAHTGSLTLLALVLIVAGAALTLVARRRRPAVSRRSDPPTHR